MFIGLGYLCAEEAQFECVGLDSGQRQHATLQPVRVHISQEKVALSIEGANVMYRLRIIPYSCRCKINDSQQQFL